MDAHVHRLEALRRAGIAERIDADHLVDQGDPSRQPDGRVTYRRNRIATLQE